MSSDVTLHAEQRGALTVYPIESARAFGVDAFFTDRFGGVSVAPYDSLNLGIHVGDDLEHVRENRRRVATAVGVDVEHFVTVTQVHGREILDETRVRDASEADALVSESSERAVAIFMADCVPILLVDSSRFALVHAGWRGLAHGVIESALACFGDVASVHAFVGPSISRESYQVGPDVAAHFVDEPGALTPDGSDRSRLDLRLVATRQLARGGVAKTAIVRSHQVTDGGEVFFSDRAQRPCGRFALVAKRFS